MRHATYREAHPLPYVLTHWAHLLSMAALIFTGSYIHYPSFDASMGAMRSIHFVAMYVVLIAFAARVWYLFAGRSAALKGTRRTERDVGNFLPQRENEGQLLETVKYYLFIRKTHPPSGKYNPLQKIAYVTMGVLLLMQAYTGLALYGPVQDNPVLHTLVDVAVNMSGGLMAVRMAHYLLMWAFIVLILVHIYLSLAEDISSVPLMFAWVETPERPEEETEPPAGSAQASAP